LYLQNAAAMAGTVGGHCRHRWPIPVRPIRRTHR